MNNLNDILLQKNKPLLVYGKSGSGKTHLALELLKDTILLRIDIIFLKDIKDIKKYILDKIQKRNITLMFQEKNECRGLLIDDIHIFYKYDKNSFNGILDLLKNDKFYNTKIIITCENHFLKNKNLNKFKHDKYHLQYNYNEYYKICLKIIKEKKFKFTFDELDYKIYDSDYNFHNFISDSKYKQISIRDNFDGIEECTHKLCNHKYSLNNIFRECSGDEKIILLNMMENIKNSLNIYKIYQFVNLFNQKDIFLKEYDLLNIPICMINYHMKYNNHKIIYNRYISKNMITYKSKEDYNQYLLYLIDCYKRYNIYRDIIITFDKKSINYNKEIYENFYDVKVSFQ